MIQNELEESPIDLLDDFNIEIILLGSIQDAIVRSTSTKPVDLVTN